MGLPKKTVDDLKSQGALKKSTRKLMLTDFLQTSTNSYPVTFVNTPESYAFMLRLIHEVMTSKSMASKMTKESKSKNKKASEFGYYRHLYFFESSQGKVIDLDSTSQGTIHEMAHSFTTKFKTMFSVPPQLGPGTGAVHVGRRQAQDETWFNQPEKIIASLNQGKGDRPEDFPFILVVSDILPARSEGALATQIEVINTFMTSLMGSYVFILNTIGESIPSSLHNKVNITNFTPHANYYEDIIHSTMQLLSIDYKNPHDNDGFINNGGASFTTAQAVTYKRRNFYMPGDPRSQKDEIINSVRTQEIESQPALSLIETKGFNVEDIGGFDRLKKEFKSVVDIRKKFKDSDKAQELNDKFSHKGYMIVGPPGTGKTLSATVMASLLEKPLIRFDVSKVLGSLQGQSERGARNALDVIARYRDCIMLIDEAEKHLGGVASSARTDGGVQTRLMEIIMKFIEREDLPEVTIIMTVNDTEHLPPELLRRVETIYSSDLPTREELKDIIKIQNRKQANGKIKIDTTEMETLAIMLDGYTGDEVRKVFKRAIRRKLSKGQSPKVIDLQLETSNIIPMSQTKHDEITKIRNYCAQNTEPVSTKSAAFQQFLDHKKTRLQTVIDKLGQEDINVPSGIRDEFSNIEVQVQN